MCRLRYRLTEAHSATCHRLCVLIYVNGRYPHFMRPRIREHDIRFYDVYAERVFYLRKDRHGP